MRKATVFGKRKTVLDKNEPKTKYFLAFEGYTEEIYCNGLNSNQDYFSVSPLIELIPLRRLYDKRGLGHPKKIIELLNDYLSNLINNSMTLQTLVKQVVSYIEEDSLFNSNIYKTKDLEENLIKHYTENCNVRELNQITDIDNFANLTIKFLENKKILPSKDTADILHTYITEDTTYDPEIDKVCIIVDRDMHSFTKKQYEKVQEECREKGYYLYIKTSA